MAILALGIKCLVWAKSQCPLYYNTMFNLFDGRQLTSNEFEQFLKNNGILHRTSAPYHPASNRQAERCVQTVKKALSSMSMTSNSGTLNDKLHLIKTQLRRTPNQSGHSAYQLMFGRDIRTTLHVMLGENFPRTTLDYGNLAIRKVFSEGDRVQVRNYLHPNKKWVFGFVTERLGRLHYRVTTDGGESWRRHADQMLPAAGVPPAD